MTKIDVETRITPDKGYLERLEKYTDRVIKGKPAKDIYPLPLNEICPRSENKYINKLESHIELKKSIEAIRLQQPIVVVPISEYKPESEEEADYLQEMVEKYGCKYFISSGERRFRAMVGIAMNKNIVQREDLIEFYEYCLSKNPYDRFKKVFVEEDDAKEKWKWYIDCNIVTKDVSKESMIYNDTNLTSRAITKFEIIDNTYDEMIKKGVEMKYNADIQKYIKENKGIDIDLGTIKSFMIVIRNTDRRFKELIYDGKLTANDARKILSTYANDPDKENVIKQINDGTFSVGKYLKSNKKEKVVRIAKKGKRWSNAEVINLLNQIRNKQLSLTEAIEWVENQK